MALTNRAAPATSLPDRIAVILQEARWFLFVAVGAYLALALYDYNFADPGWSHAVQADQMHNSAGRFGAWLSDLLLYLFGFSAWWWVVLCGFLVWRGYRRLDEVGLLSHNTRRLLFMLLGFFAVLLASAALESLRFYSHDLSLPLVAGGVLGLELGAWLARNLGFTGGTLTLLLIFCIGWSLLTGISWLRTMELLGGLFEVAFLAAKNVYEAWQDRRIGKAVAQEREEIVEVEKKRHPPHEPLKDNLSPQFVEPTIALEIASVIEPLPIESSPIESPPLQIHRPPKVEIQPQQKTEKHPLREKLSVLPLDLAVGGLLPPLQLLDPAPPVTDTVSTEALESTSRLIERKLADFGVKVQVVSAQPGPVITRYEFEPAVGVKGSTIMNLAKDLARALSLVSVRLVETVPGKSCMALELPNSKRQMVKLSEIMSSSAYSNMSSPITLTLGKDIGGQPVVADLAKMPHLLVAGTTGSGKSVGVNAMILSMIFKSEPESVRMIMVDPKMLELSIYEGIPHLLAPVVTDMKQAANALTWCVAEMEKRYKLMSALGVRNLTGANVRIRDAEKAGKPLTNPFSLTPETPEPLKTFPHIVVVIDELADLMMVVGKKVEELIARLAQKARASGIHLILATQRPSVDVITGLIKANIPTRISFQVSSKIDSRTIIDQMGAEALLGQGDMLYLAPGTGYPTRVHGAFVSDEEVHRVVEYLKQAGPPEYVEDVLNGVALDGEEGGGEGEDEDDAESDKLYDQAVDIVVKSRRASISLVQRHLRIGYNRSARLVEAMEKAGVVSAADQRGAREVLAPARAE